MDGARPTIQPGPQLPSASTTAGNDGAEYAVVSKVKKPAAEPATGPEDNTYATVDKSKKTSPPPRPTAAAEPTKESSTPATVPGGSAKPDVQPKPTKPAKAEKPKKVKAKDKKRGKKGNCPLLISSCDTDVIHVKL